MFDLAFVEGGTGVRALLADVVEFGLVLSETATWDVATGRQRSCAPLTIPTRGCDTAFSADGRRMAAAAYFGLPVRVWDLEAGTEILRIGSVSSGTKRARGLAFTPDGTALAVGREDGSFDVWEVPSGRLRRSFAGHDDGYYSTEIRFSPDGRCIASHGEKAGPLSTWQEVRLMGSKLLSRSDRVMSPELIVLDVATGERLARAPRSIRSSFSPDGSTIATFDEDFRVRLRPFPGR